MTAVADSRPTNPLDDQFPVIVDLARPDRPAEVGRWWLPGTQHGDGSPPPRHEVFDAGFRAHNINVYAGRPGRAYVGYLDGGAVILDITDAGSPAMVSRLDYHPPMPGFTHTVLPLLRNHLLAISDESVDDAAADFPKLLWFADVSHETSPLIISSAPLPPVAEFAHRGGRFGAHNLHENEPFAWSWQDEDVVFGSFFNAGVRAYDVRNPFQPAEVAAFVPPAPPGSRIGAPRGMHVRREAISPQHARTATAFARLLARLSPALAEKYVLPWAGGTPGIDRLCTAVTSASARPARRLAGSQARPQDAAVLFREAMRQAWRDGLDPAEGCSRMRHTGRSRA
jgi:hypothetical protein